MARAVYSVQLMSLAPVLPSQTVVVPDNVKIIVRDVDVYENSGNVNAELVVDSAAGGTLWAALWVTHPLYSGWQWRGRQVYNPGESIRVQSLVGSWSLQMSGYELTLP